jgi:copper oxidase (laccase) domain-containing protein
MAVTGPPGAFIPFAFPGLPGIGCAFGTRLGGSIVPYPGGPSAAAAAVSRHSLLRGLGLADWSELRQAHGDSMLAAPAATPLAPDAAAPLLPEADGQCSATPGLALCIKTADCQPVFLAHKKGCVAALHVGWRGNRLDFPYAGARFFCAAYALDPAEVLAVRGPSLGPAAAEFVNFDREWGPGYAPWFDARHKTMDLWALTRDQLRRAGLLPRNIFGLDLCTRSLPDRFFSYRLQDAGRQASLVWVKSG